MGSTDLYHQLALVCDPGLSIDFDKDINKDELCTIEVCYLLSDIDLSILLWWFV